MRYSTQLLVRDNCKFVWDNSEELKTKIKRCCQALFYDFSSFFPFDINLDFSNLIIGKEYKLSDFLNNLLIKNENKRRINICEKCGVVYIYDNNIVEDIDTLDNNQIINYNKFYKKDTNETYCGYCISREYKECPIDGKYHKIKDFIYKTLNIVYNEHSESIDSIKIHKRKCHIYKDNSNIKRGTIFVVNNRNKYEETTRKDVQFIAAPQINHSYANNRVFISYYLTYFKNIKELNSSELYKENESYATYIKNGILLKTPILIENTTLQYDQISEIVRLERIGYCNNCHNFFIKENENQSYCNSCLTRIANAKYVVKSYSTKFDKVIEPKKQFQHCFNDNSMKNLYYGVEIEANVVDSFCFNETVKDVLVRTDGYMFAKHDGSLDNERGVEFVSAPASFEKTREFLNKLFNNNNLSTTDLDWNDDEGYYGIHIHVSRTPLTKQDIARIVYFFNEHEGFCEEIGEREYNSYCKSRDVVLRDSKGNIKELDTYIECLDCRDRYRCVNLCNSSTIEIRIFESIIDREHIFRYLEFVDAVIRLSKRIGLRETYGFKYMNPKNLKRIIVGNNKYKFLLKAIKENWL